MQTLPYKFLQEAEQAENHPFALLQIDSRGQSAEATSEADWGGATSESNVDYTSTPPDAGDVILAEDPAVINITTSHCSPVSETYNSFLGGTWSDIDEYPTANDADRLITANSTGGQTSYFTGAIDNIQDLINEIPINAHIFSIYIISRDYWDGISATNGQFRAGIKIAGVNYWTAYASLASGAYYGQLFRFLTNPVTGLAWTRDELSSIEGIGTYGTVDSFPDDAPTLACSQLYMLIRWYDFLGSGNITVQLDLGASVTTANNGTVTIDDVVPTGTGLTYILEGSATGAWGGEEVSLGAVKDGSVVAGYRYYRPTGNFTSDGSATPVLKSISIEIPDNIYKFSTLLDDTLDALPLIQSIPSRTIEVDLKSFLTKTSNITINLIRDEFVDEMVRGNYFRGLAVNMKLGMLSDGITKDDLIPYYQGRVVDYKLSPTTLNIEVQDASKDLSRKWPIGTAPSTKPSQSYSSPTHMADVINGIIDDIGILTRYVDRGSLAGVKANVGDGDPASENYVVFRGVDGATDTTITETKPAKDYITELLHLLGAFMVIPENGKMTFVLYSSSTVAEEAWDDTVFGPDISFAAGLKGLKNVTDLYYDNTGDGDELKNFASAYITADSGSISNWDITAMQQIKALWLAGDSSTGYYGDELAAEITARETARLKDGLGSFNCKTSLAKAGLQVGDFIDIDSDTVIKPDVGKGSTQKFIIVKKTWNPETNAISWVGMEAR